MNLGCLMKEGVLFTARPAAMQTDGSAAPVTPPAIHALMEEQKTAPAVIKVCHHFTPKTKQLKKTSHSGLENVDIYILYKAQWNYLKMTSQEKRTKNQWIKMSRHF